MNTQPVQSVHHKKHVYGLAKKIVNKEATESDFRTFFVVMRDSVRWNSLTKQLCHASAHPNKLDRHSPVDGCFHHNMCSTVMIGRSFKFDLNAITNKFAEYTAPLFDEEYGPGAFSLFYTKGLDEKWNLSPFAIGTEYFIKRLYSTLRPADLDPDTLAKEFDNALSRFCFRDNIAFSSDPDVAGDLAVAMAVTVHGIKIKMPWGGYIRLGVSVTDYRKFGPPLEGGDVCVCSITETGFPRMQVAVMRMRDLEHTFESLGDEILDSPDLDTPLDAVRAADGKLKIRIGTIPEALQ